MIYNLAEHGEEHLEELKKHVSEFNMHMKRNPENAWPIAGLIQQDMQTLGGTPEFDGPFIEAIHKQMDNNSEK